MARLVSLIVLTVLMVFLGITFYQVVTPFLLPLFLAAILAVLCQPVYRFFLKQTHNRPRLSAGLTTTTVIAALLIPLLIGTVAAAVELVTIAQNAFGGRDWDNALQAVRTELELDHAVARIEALSGIPIDADQLQQEIQTNLQTGLKLLGQRTVGIAGAAVGMLVSSLMFVIGLYYFLADGPALLEAGQQLIPVHVDYQRQMLSQFDRVVRAVVLSTFLAAGAQGLATATALSLVGMGHFFLFLMVATVASLIPVAGTWLVWGPCAVWLAWQGHWGQAVFLTAVGSLLIGTMDNVIRTYVLHSDAKLHPLLAFVSVLGGLQLMGLWGVFVGPIVASCLHALVQIFNTELMELSKETFGPLADKSVKPSAPEETPPDKPVVPPSDTTVTEDAVGSCKQPSENVAPAGRKT